MSNRNRVFEEVCEATKNPRHELSDASLMIGMLCTIAVEMGGINDELHSIRLALDKLTKEVGKRK